MPIMQRPIFKRVEYKVSALPIERLFRGESACITRAYGALTRNGIRTIGELIERRNEVPGMKGVGFGTWNVIIGCMMDFDTKHGTHMRDSFTDNP
jgi:hypothetical protein